MIRYDMVVSPALSRNDVICLDLHPAESMTDTATPVTSRQQFGNLIPCEGHGGGDYSQLWFGVEGTDEITTIGPAFAGARHFLW
jgi:hypothetical protein